MVDREQPLVSGMFPQGVTPGPRLLVRRLGRGLGSTSVGSVRFRPMVRRRKENVHKHEGAQSCQTGTSGISRISSGQNGGSLHRQYYGSGILEESRGNDVSKTQPRSTGDSQMVRGKHRVVLCQQVLLGLRNVIAESLS